VWRHVFLERELHMLLRGGKNFFIWGQRRCERVNDQRKQNNKKEQGREPSENPPANSYTFFLLGEEPVSSLLVSGMSTT
jgi:hypothetical protein